MNKRIINVGETVYTVSTERYGYPTLCECVVEERSDDTLYLYAIEENRAFYRDINEVMTKEEIAMDIKRIFNVEI